MLAASSGIIKQNLMQCGGKFHCKDARAQISPLSGCMTLGKLIAAYGFNFPFVMGKMDLITVLD